MTNKDENINNDMLNNEKENDTTLEAPASEQSENIEEEMTATATETEENKDCGKLPQNKKDKKNKWLLLVLGITTVIIAGLLTTQFLSKGNKPEEPIDYMQYVQGIQDLEITSSKDKYDYLTNITFDKEHISEVTVDDSQVDLTKAGEYQLTYLIDVKDEKVEDLKQVVTVKVVTAKKEDDKKPKDKDKQQTTTSSSQNQTDTNNQSKPNNTSSTNSQPSNSGSSNNTNKKPTSPTHTHRYVTEYKDIQHEEKGHYETVTVSEAWDEPIYNTYEIMICNECNLEMYSANEYYSHRETTKHGGFHSDFRQEIIDTIHHPAKTEKQWVVDENGWTETVTTYKCSCGATK